MTQETPIIPRKQWQEELNDAIKNYYRLNCAEAIIKIKKEELRSQIITVMKKNKAKTYLADNLQATHSVKQRLISDLKKMKKALGEIWPSVSEKKEAIKRNALNLFIKEGVVTKKQCTQIFIPEDNLSVKKVEVPK